MFSTNIDDINKDRTKKRSDPAGCMFIGNVVAQ